MMKKGLSGIVVLVLLAGALTGCPLCDKLDVGMVLSYSPSESLFNASAWHGLLQASREMPVSPGLQINETFADFEPGINHYIEKQAGMIIEVGYQGLEAASAAAVNNPDISFVCVDVEPEDLLPNLTGAIFDIGPAAFRAGYLAAGMTTTGKVATMGGMDIPPVTALMDAFAEGVAHYNVVKGAHVEVLGLETFLGSFDDEAACQAVAKQQLADGADILFPAAGDAIVGALNEVANSPNALFIGVDVDWYRAQPDYADVILTSVMKHLDKAVFEMVSRKVEGTLDNTTYVGTIENGGVGLAPYHDCETLVPEALQNEVAALVMAAS